MSRARLKNYDLRYALLRLLQIQKARIDRGYKEENFRWKQSSDGKRELSSTLTKELAAMLEIVDRLFEVGGKNAEGKVTEEDKEAQEEAEVEAGEVVDDINALMSRARKKSA